MGTRARVVMAFVMVVMPVMLACATQQVRLQMVREVELIPPVISDLKTDPAGEIDTRGQGRTVQVTMTGDPELQATFDLKGGVQGQEMRETEPGVYVGTFQVRPNDTGSLDVVGHLLHSPTGASQAVSRDGALVLVSDGAAPDGEGRTECQPGEMAEFEKQIEGLIVLFQFNEYPLTPGAGDLLTRNQAALTSHPACTIHVHGHADDVGSEEYNATLSALRAGEVAAFLQQNLGIPAGRVAVQWHGESMPVDTSGTAEGRARNRRVELHAFQPE